VGSLRNPIGPLPSTIYWRRRAIALALVAVLALLVIWAISFGTGGKGSNEGKSGGGHGPATSITPGPTDSGPAISERPGGRDDAGGTGSSSTGGGAEDSGAGGAGGGGGTGGAGAAGGGSSWVPAGDASGGTGGSGGDGGSGDAAVPAGSDLPDCAVGDVTVSLHSEHKTYAPDQKPTFKLKLTNERGTACKLDLGRKATVVTVSQTGSGSADEKFWSSDDCTEGAKPALIQLPASGESVHTFTWYRQPSAENCGTPSKGSAKPGSYKAEVKVEALKKATAKFSLT
jgi:hypothetical protein